MAFIRKIRKGDSTYLAKVESYRKDGKVKQRVLEYIGKDDNGKVIPKKTIPSEFNVTKITRYLDILTIDAIANKLELHDYLGNNYKILLSLVYSHLLEKVSIYKIPEWVEQTEVASILKLKKITAKDLYLSMTDFGEMNFDIIQKMLSKKYNEIEKDNNIAVLDITDTYFNGKEATWKARRGKDGKYDKLIQIALAVSYNNGFPILHKIYEGNISNIKIFEDIINDLKIYGYNSIIVDRGMSSKKNINNLLQYGLQGIMGLKVTENIGKKYLLGINRDEIFSKKNQVELKNTKLYIKGFEYMEGRLITVFNPTIEIAQREKYIEKTNPGRTSKYFGYSLIYHNLDKPDKEIVEKYFAKDIVERSFKRIKGVISLHPFNVWKLENIISHIKICYLSYAILSYMQYYLKTHGISACDAIKILKGGYKVFIEFTDTKKTISKIVTLKNIQQQIIDALNVVYNF